MTYSAATFARSAGRFFAGPSQVQTEDLQDLPDYVLKDMGVRARDLPAKLREGLDAQARVQDRLSAAKKEWF